MLIHYDSLTSIELSVIVILILIDECMLTPKINKYLKLQKLNLHKLLCTVLHYQTVLRYQQCQVV